MSRRPRKGDTPRDLTFREEYRVRVAGALLLHAGTAAFWLSEGVLAAPWWRVL